MEGNDGLFVQSVLLLSVKVAANGLECAVEACFACVHVCVCYLIVWAGPGLCYVEHVQCR